MAKSMKEKFEAALRARGETLVDTGKANKWTRNYPGLRDGTGALRPRTPDQAPYWFVGAAGSLRLGHNRAGSRPVADVVKQALLEEGAAQFILRK